MAVMYHHPSRWSLGKTSARTSSTITASHHHRQGCNAFSCYAPLHRRRCPQWSHRHRHHRHHRRRHQHLRLSIPCICRLRPVNSCTQWRPLYRQHHLPQRHPPHKARGRQHLRSYQSISALHPLHCTDCGYSRSHHPVHSPSNRPLRRLHRHPHSRRLIAHQPPHHPPHRPVSP